MSTIHWTVSLAVLFQLVSAASQHQELLPSGASPVRRSDLLNVEKECAEFGGSVGRLEWRLWREGDRLTARCDLHRPAPGLAYAISWTSGRDVKSSTVLQLCEFDHADERDGEMFCLYKTLVPRYLKDLRLVCWVRTTNQWNSEIRTACTSDDMVPEDTAEANWTLRRDKLEDEDDYMKAPMRLPPAPLDSDTTPRAHTVEELRWGQKYLPDSDADSDTEDFNKKLQWQNIQPRKPFGHYLVDVGPDVFVKCNLIDEFNELHQVRWSFNVRARLDFSPQAMTWNCTAMYAERLPGVFEIFMRRGNMTRSGNFGSGYLLKKCRRHQDEYRLPLSCEMTLPLTDYDVGAHAFICSYRYVTRNMSEPSHCEELPHFVRYNVSLDPMWTRRRKIAKIPVIFNEKSRPRGLNRVLPFYTGPQPGPGVRLNGEQLAYVGCSSMVGMLALGCCCSGFRTAFKMRTQNLESLPCHCLDTEKKIIAMRLSLRAATRNAKITSSTASVKAKK